MIKLLSIESLLHIVSAPHITCLINSWGRAEGQITNDSKSTCREAGQLNSSPFLSGI